MRQLTMMIVYEYMHQITELIMSYCLLSWIRLEPYCHIYLMPFRSSKPF